MKSARLAGGLVALGIGLVTVGIGRFSTQSHGMVAPLDGDATHSPWAWTAPVYETSVTGRASDSNPAVTAQLYLAEDGSLPILLLNASDANHDTTFSLEPGLVSIAGGDFNFPAGSTILGGEPATVSLQGMHAQVQGHAGLHSQHADDLDALTKRIEDLEAIIKSLPDCACSADLNRDGLVNGEDLGRLLGAWGQCAQ